MFKKLVHRAMPVAEILMLPFTYAAAAWLLFIRKYGVHNLPASRNVFWKLGVFPIRDHYYEPLFNPKHLNLHERDARKLTGIDINEAKQLALLKQFHYQEELKQVPMERREGKLEYYYSNPSFFAGDSEILYSVLRYFKPKNIIEIGSGNSTLMMLNALKKNKEEDSNYECSLKCVEPYEVPWLEQAGVTVLRKKVQDIDLEFFQVLKENDILFIDSSHMIRPQGDVLFEYLEVLPTLAKGVIVHIHDIFTPRDYLHENYENYVVFLNEQYLVEAFLTLNPEFEIISALNFLKHDHFESLAAVCPILANSHATEPRSIWLRKIA